MRINTKVVIDMTTGEVLERESYEYEGPLALCGGGSETATAPSTSHTTSTERSSPWKPQIPYIKRGFAQAGRNLRTPNYVGPGQNSQAAMRAYGQGGVQAGRIMAPVRAGATQLAQGNGLGMGQLNATAQGEYMGKNPFMQAYGNDIIEQTNGMFSGNLDSGYHNKILGRELGSVAAGMYGDERDRMLSAAGQLGDSQRANLGVASGIAGMNPEGDQFARAGAMREGYQQRQMDAPDLALERYMQAISGNYGGTTSGSSSTTSSNPSTYSNPWGMALGGAATGAGIGAAFGPWGAGIGALGGGALGFLS